MTYFSPIDSKFISFTGTMTTDEGPLYQFVNCQLLRDHQLIVDDLWVRNGKILNPEKLFFDEKVTADIQINCKGNIIAPGFIDVQINGKVIDNLMLNGKN